MTTTEAAVFVLAAVVVVGVVLVALQAPPPAAIRRTTRRPWPSHCTYCHHRIWPWQRRGWYISWIGAVAWHGACWRRTHA